MLMLGAVPGGALGWGLLCCNALALVVAFARGGEGPRSVVRRGLLACAAVAVCRWAAVPAGVAPRSAWLWADGAWVGHSLDAALWLVLEDAAVFLACRGLPAALAQTVAESQLGCALCVLQWSRTSALETGVALLGVFAAVLVNPPVGDSGLGVLLWLCLRLLEVADYGGVCGDHVALFAVAHRRAGHSAAAAVLCIVLQKEKNVGAFAGVRVILLIWLALWLQLDIIMATRRLPPVLSWLAEKESGKES